MQLFALNKFDKLFALIIIIIIILSKFSLKNMLFRKLFYCIILQKLAFYVNYSLQIVREGE